MDGLLQDDLFGIITVGYAELLSEALHQAVLSDDVGALDKLLKEPTADINGLKFGDNLLVTAIKHERQTAAVWLIEHGIDADFETCHLVLHEQEKPQPQQPQEASSADDASPSTAASSRRLARQSSKQALADGVMATRRGGRQQQQPQQQQQQQPQQQQQQLPPPPQPDLYSITCRQLAYEMQLWKVVSAIDARKGAHRMQSRRYPDMRLYRRQRRDSSLPKQHAIREHRDEADAPADGQNETDRVSQANGSDDSAEDDSDKGGEAAADAHAAAEASAWPARRIDAPQRRRQLLDEEEERLLASSTTITWCRSTLTKSAKLRQRAERKLCAAAAAAGACHCVSGCCPPPPSARAARISAADEARGATPAPPPVVGACACQLSEELSRLLTAAASAASAVGATQRPRTVERTSKAFSHPTVRRSQSSGRRASGQPSAA